MKTELDFDAHYRVKGWPGVAVYIYGWPQRYEPYTYLAYVDDDGNETHGRDSKGRFCRQVELPGDDGEWVDDIGDSVIVVMVGDDAKHTVDISDLEKIGELEFCRECGQIGCGCNVYE